MAIGKAKFMGNAIRRGVTTAGIASLPFMVRRSQQGREARSEQARLDTEEQRRLQSAEQRRIENRDDTRFQRAVHDLRKAGLDPQSILGATAHTQAGGANVPSREEEGPDEMLRWLMPLALLLRRMS